MFQIKLYEIESGQINFLINHSKLNQTKNIFIFKSDESLSQNLFKSNRKLPLLPIPSKFWLTYINCFPIKSI